MTLVFFLSIAIGFSWFGCISTFAAQPDVSVKTFTKGTAFVSICITAFGLCFADRSLAFGVAAMVLGLAIAYSMGKFVKPWVAFAISATGLAAYVYAVGT